MTLWKSVDAFPIIARIIRKLHRSHPRFIHHKEIEAGMLTDAAASKFVRAICKKRGAKFPPEWEAMAMVAGFSKNYPKLPYQREFSRRWDHGYAYKPRRPSVEHIYPGKVQPVGQEQPSEGTTGEVKLSRPKTASPTKASADQNQQSHPKNRRPKLPANPSMLSGDTPYLQRARAAFPILVSQALARETIYYSDLADELGMANPRNLNHVLGAVGKSIRDLGSRWKEQVPPLQCLVVNKNTGIPGEGIGWFVSDLKDFKHRTPEERKQIVRIELSKVFNYPKWANVLGAFQLRPLVNDATTANLIAKARGGGGVGECEDHRKLKQYVATNPQVIGLSGFGKGETEYCFPSADRIDIVFRSRERWVGVEVKGPASPDDDLIRGLFQTVKYIALREAELKSECRKGQTEVILVLSRRLPAHLKQLKNLLGVTVVDGVVVR